MAPAGTQTTAWLVMALVVVVMVVSGETDGADPKGGQVEEIVGAVEAKALRAAVKAAKASIAAAEKSKDAKAIGAAMGSLAHVQSMTLKLNTVVKKPNEEMVDPMAHVRVKSDPRKEEITFPALGLKMNTETVVDPVDGTPGPVSITAEVMGNDVAKERKKLADEVNKDTKSEVAKFGNVDKVLSKNGFGQGFGRLRTAAATADDKKNNAETEAKQDRSDARKLIRQSMKTTKTVRKAMKKMLDLKKDQGKERLRKQKRRQEARDERQKWNQMKVEEEHATWDNIRSMTDNFNQEFQLGKHSKQVRSATEQAKVVVDKTVRKEVSPLPSNDDKKFEAQLDSAANVKNAEAAELLREKRRTMSFNEKDATINAKNDVQSTTDQAEKKEQQKQETVAKSEEASAIAKAEKATQAVKKAENSARPQMLSGY